MRVRLDRIEDRDLRVFDFDYDVTFMIFFLDADQRVYARYGGRVSEDADQRQSLAGLRHTMESVLAMHQREDKQFAPRRPGPSFTIQDVTDSRNYGRCLHCHEAKEVLHERLRREGKWTVDEAFRFPPPDNLGWKLDVDRSNVVEAVLKDSPAERAGMQPGDRLRTLNGVPIHSFGDAQYALDRAPSRGAIEVAWLRDDRPRQAQLVLPAGWRRTDISWRPSLSHLVASARLFGKDLGEAEKGRYDLAPGQLAFRQQENLAEQARAAGIRPDDIILGFDGQVLEMTAYGFQTHVRRRYVKGEVVQVDLIRDGRRLALPMTLR